MLRRQRGTLNLYWVAIFSAVFAAVAMAAIYSMRYERNVFAEGWAKLGKLIGASPAQGVADAARAAVGAGDGAGTGGAMRKCLIDGKPVISNTDCSDKNPSSKAIKIYDTKGFEAPKQPVPVDPAPTSNPAIDKIIEKQLR
jgi:hypothetical protein